MRSHCSYSTGDYSGQLEQEMAGEYYRNHSCAIYIYVGIYVCIDNLIGHMGDINHHTVDCRHLRATNKNINLTVL